MKVCSAPTELVETRELSFPEEGLKEGSALLCGLSCRDGNTDLWHVGSGGISLLEAGSVV